MNKAKVKRFINKQKKSRHWCLTAWLTLMLVGNIAGIFLVFGAYISSVDIDPENDALVGITDGFSMIFIIIIFILLINLICIIRLFRWQKSGFWGCCLVAGIMFALNLALGEAASAFQGLLGLAILYGALQVGDDNKGWPQLE